MNHNVSLKSIILGPIVFALIMVMLVVHNYMNIVNEDIDNQYAYIDASLTRSAKVITSLDYSFTSYFKNRDVQLVDLNREVSGGLCRMWPFESSILADNKSHDIPTVEISYMLVGKESLCDESSALFKRAARKIALAPILSFLHDLDDFIYGIHYVDNFGYVMSSPDTVSKNINKDTLAIVKSRPYWQKTAANHNQVTVSGPAIFGEFSLSEPVLSMTLPVMYKDKFQGAIALNIEVDKLLNKQSKLTNLIHLIDNKTTPVPDNAYREKLLNIDGFDFHHLLYYELNWHDEFKNFLEVKKFNLTVVFIVYLFSVVTLFYFNSRVEQAHLKDLAARDPMTGLLNRRGLETFLSKIKYGEYAVIAVLDIDDFKVINDTYGHDVGDNVICYVADQLETNTRDSDAVARFGGEEFVVYLTGHNVERMKQIMQRVKDAIVTDSSRVIDSGFTISGGVEVVKKSSGDFETWFKAADEKLYQAKKTGKNKLVF